MRFRNDWSGPALTFVTCALRASPETSFRRSTTTALPPLFRTRCISVSATAGFGKFCSAERQTMTSKASSSKGMSATSPWWNSTAAISLMALLRAILTNVSLMSRQEIENSPRFASSIAK